MAKLLDDNGILKQEFVKGEDGKFHVKTSQDVSDIIESNKYQQQHGVDFSTKKPYHRVASIPNVVVHKLIKEGIWNDPVALRAFLDDPDNKFMRTDKGTRKLGRVKRVYMG